MTSEYCRFPANCWSFAWLGCPPQISIPLPVETVRKNSVYNKYFRAKYDKEKRKLIQKLNTVDKEFSLGEKYFVQLPRVILLEP